MKDPIIWLAAIILFLLIWLTGFRTGISLSVPMDGTNGIAIPTEGYTFDDLLDAIEWVESRGDSNAIGDNGRAIGCMQIHEIYVDDVNRIQAKKSKHKYQYPYGARYSSHLSREMVTIYLNHYGGTFEEMARKHNGGPQGHKKESTKKYWLKVKNSLDDRFWEKSHE